MTDFTPIKKQMTYHMARLYCLRRHHSTELCEECRSYLDHAYRHLDNCPHKDEGRPCPTCPDCCFTGADYYVMVDMCSFDRIEPSIGPDSPGAHNIDPNADPADVDKGPGDPRAESSVDTIKRAFLKLLETNRFQQISVASLCREAGVGRTTFYAHFQSMDELLDAVLFDFTASIDLMPSEVGYPDWPHKPAGKPMCIAIRESRAMQTLFFDDSLVDRCVEYVHLSMSPRLVHSMMDKVMGNPQGFDTLFRSQTYACMKAVKDSIEDTDDKWDMRKKEIDTFLRGGLIALRSRPPLSYEPRPDAPRRAAGSTWRGP